MAGHLYSKMSSSIALGDGILIANLRQIIVLGVSVALVSYVLGIIIYRLYFHPLAKYPGPFLAKVTSLYDFYQAFSEYRAHNFLALHKKYGPVVRFAPDNLCFNDSEAFQGIYGFKANVRKADFFAASQSDAQVTDTFSELYKDAALKKRKILSQGFSENSLRSFEGYIVDQINIMCRQLVNPDVPKVKDMARWLNFLSYDCMGEMVFGRGFGMLTDPSLHYILDLIDSTVFSYLLGGTLPLLHKTGLMTVFLPHVYFMRKRFVTEAHKRVQERISKGPEANGVNNRKDFFHHLLNARDSETGQPLSEAQLSAEGVLLILAGSDTTSAAMAGCLFYLMQQKGCQDKLFEELERTFVDVNEIRGGAKLTSCIYLRACAEEALRMSSSAPGLSPRTVLKGGTVINGEYFPEGVTVGMSGWATAYNKRYFRDPERYWPERHIQGEGVPAEEIQAARDAYWPFSLGPRKCPGLKVAYNELHLTIARLVYLFEITPEKPDELKENFIILDHSNPKKVGPFASFKLRPGRELPDTKPVEL